MKTQKCLHVTDNQTGEAAMKPNSYTELSRRLNGDLEQAEEGAGELKKSPQKGSHFSWVLKDSISSRSMEHVQEHWYEK